MKAQSLRAVRQIINNFDRQNPVFKDLYGAYKDSIDPALSFTHFFEMYFNNELVEIDLTIYHYAGRRAGLSVAFFYSTTVNGKKTFIARSATGLIPALQGMGLHNSFGLYKKFIRFFFMHPFTPIWVAAYVINPFVFRNFCKFIPAVFPAPGREVPAEAGSVLDFVAESGNHPRDPLHPLSLEVPIQVHFPEALLQRIYASKNIFVKWYLDQNPNFRNKYGLLVVIAVSCSNIAGTLVNFIRIKADSKVDSVNKMLRSNAGNIVTLVIQLFRRRIF